ncbi:hypothetical protein Q7C18_09225 [Nesterenkonia sp. CL21]|uniref:ApeA N-terminal domain 1-containing protein n=1 Tax=Nesterenkonia sp. CL21 TaxID=3064894 RepID=UPI002878FF26|nr:HEPN domain-containing protein [Nesterenkonia sp. CL21]MDS2172876.1 hypothetical protein [Nesterenkonia sp. CL21]
MILQQHLSGTWWPDDRPSPRRVGTLSVSQSQGGHLRLRPGDAPHPGAWSSGVLHGLLDGPAADPSQERAAAPLVPDEQVPGRSVTLFGALPLPVDASGAPEEGDVAVDAILVGDTVDSPEQHRYRRATLEIPELAPWSARTMRGESADEEAAAAAAGPDSVSVAVACRTEEPSESHSLQFTATPSLGHVEVEVVDPNQDGLSVEEIRRNAHAIQDLFSLASLAPPAGMRARIPADDTHGEVLLYWRQTLTFPSQISPGGSLIFSAAELEITAALQRWYELRLKHRVTIDLLMGMLRAPHRYTELNLLVIVAAAEALFATTDGRSKRQRKDSTLRLKLVAMAERVKLASRIDLGLPVQEWAERTARVRNSFTHTGGATDYTEAQLGELVGLTTAVVVANLVQDLGVPPEAWSRGLAHTPALRRLRPADVATLF